MISAHRTPQMMAQAQRRPHAARPLPRRHRHRPVRCAAAAADNLQAAAAATGTEALFKPLKIGDVTLEHRVVMAPLTRCRAIGGVPPPMTVEYYSQRTTRGGLIISEATCVSDTALGYPCTPTLFQPEALEAWRPVVQGIHDKGGIFFMQLWHCGRASHPDYQPDGKLPMAPSALRIEGDYKVVSPKDFQQYDYQVPRAMDKQEIKEVVQSFKQAARNAMAVGADGVEIHGASGYLINQFLNQLSNQRGDEYGGSIENRARFALEVVEAVCEGAGSAGRVAIRFSPFGHYLMTPDPQTYSLYTYLLTELNKCGLSYIHLVEPRSDDMPLSALSNVSGSRPDSLAPFRQVFGGPIVVAGGHTGATAAQAVQADCADAVAFGRYFISTPDLARRIALGAPHNKYDRSTFYGQGPEGYIDYPFLEDTPEGRTYLAQA
jgi:2,4-dienoyl-CoA reductase-like NADH-dependent reductase (Old Yellow Enzyme family)